jgi:hypothetical protein
MSVTLVTHITCHTRHNCLCIVSMAIKCKCVKGGPSVSNFTSTGARFTKVTQWFNSGLKGLLFIKKLTAAAKVNSALLKLTAGAAAKVNSGRAGSTTNFSYCSSARPLLKSRRCGCNFARLLTFPTFPTEKLTAVPTRQVYPSRKRAVDSA